MADPYVLGAARWCQNLHFCRFLECKLSHPIQGKESAAEALRQLCGINSRAELATDDRARAIYKSLISEFNQFMKVGSL